MPDTKQTEVKKSSFKDFVKRNVLFIVLALMTLFAVGMAGGIYLAYQNSRKSTDETNKQSQVTPTPTLTQTPTPTSAVTSTPITVITAKPTLAQGKFSIVTRDVKDEVYGTSSFWDIKLNDSVIKSLKEDRTGCLNNIPQPVVSNDGSKVYYVDPSKTNEVREISTNKVDKVFYTAPAKYKYILSIAINPKGKMAYSLTDLLLVTCDGREYNSPKAAHIVDGKVFDQELWNAGVYSTISAYGENYIITQLELAGVGVGGGAATTYLHKASDMSKVNTFSSSAMFYSNGQSALLIDGLFDMVYDQYPTQSILDIDLNTGATYIALKDVIIQDYTVDGNKLIVKHGGTYNFETFKFEGKSETFEYDL